MKWLTSFLPLFLLANPQNISVQAGTATLHEPTPNTLEIQTSDRAILHWKDFSIASHETTRFLQPNAKSAVLNRIQGKSPPKFSETSRLMEKSISSIPME